MLYLEWASEPGSSVSIVSELLAGRSGDRISVVGGAEKYSTCLDRPWGPPSFLYNGYRVFPEVKNGWGVMLTPHPLLVSLVMKE
jgi:hypothetical protein